MALKGIVTGNNTVGAVVIIREIDSKGNNIEYIFGGYNEQRVRSKIYHAELNAINAYLQRDHFRFLCKRKGPDPKTDPIKLMIASTREPCNKCAAEILLADIPVVMIGAKDKGGGGMCDGREKNLSPDFLKKWNNLHMKVITPESDPKSPYYVAFDYRSILEVDLGTDNWYDFFKVPKSQRESLEDWSAVKGDEIPIGYAFGLLPGIVKTIKNK